MRACVCRASLTYERAMQVQGVNFRSGAVDQANKLGVVGHVENTSGGTVTGEVQGDSQPVAQMKVWRDGLLLSITSHMRDYTGFVVQEWLQHKGPPGSQIDNCSITGEESIDKLTYSSFEKH